MNALHSFLIVALVVLALGAFGVAAAHVILHKSDVRAAIGWIGLITLVPIVGPAMYGLFGINRIRRRATVLRPQRSPPSLPRGQESAIAAPALPTAADDAGHLAPVVALVDAMTPSPLTSGNAIVPLADGEAAYADMLAAIRGARHTVGLASFILDNDAAGRLFCDALAGAVERGVSVRVLIDGVGARYSYPPITTKLKRLGVPVDEFLPTFVPLQLPYANLRNHRKILVVDGCIGFTGGMNIRNGYLSRDRDKGAVRDLHFRLEGPVVGQIAQTFAEDWAFCSNEILAGAGWFPALPPAGNAAARAIAAGPDEEVERIRWTMIGALSHARNRVRIVTPYFLPDRLLVTALAMAAMRGVAVEILLPRQGNLRLVQWAAKAQLGNLLAQGCQIWETPPPFDHSKLMTVDDTWCLFGSANWDERSLRLNFELDIECYDAGLATRLDRLIDDKQRMAEEVTMSSVEGRAPLVKLRDGAAWLLSPYL